MPHKTKLLFVLFSFLGYFSCVAQEHKDQKVIIYYYDGSIFQGKIVAEDSTQIILIPSTKVDTLHVAKAFIHKMFRDADNVILYPGGKYHYTTGKFFSYASGFNLNEGNGSSELEMLLGQRLSQKVSVGIGIQLALHAVNNVNNGNNFNTPNIGEELSLFNGFIPLFAYGQYYLTNKKARLFVSANLGYGIAAQSISTNEHSGGIYFQPAIGLHFASNRFARSYMAIGQTFQQSKGTQFSRDNLGNEVRFNYEYLFNRTLLKFGAVLK